MDWTGFLDELSERIPFPGRDKSSEDQGSDSERSGEEGVSQTEPPKFKPTLPSTEIFRDDLLEGESVLITGGGTGIGKQLALAFADHGADVAIASRNMDHLAPVRNKIQEKNQQACATTVDVRERSSVDEMRDEVLDELGHISVLVNNAGANFITPTEDLTEEGWKSVVGTILDGTANCSISVGEYMIENDIEGCILANGATNSVRGAPYHAHSGAGKAGVHNLMQSLAAEWAQYGIRANTVAPGIIETEGAQEITGGGFPKRLLKMLSADRFGVSEDCVPIFLFLASGAASYITGAYVAVDGGHLLAPTSL